MWGDHLLASLRRPYHISTAVRNALAFLFPHLPRNDTISRILWMRNRRHIFLQRWVCCKCSFCRNHSGFCNYSTDRLKSWIKKHRKKFLFLTDTVVQNFLGAEVKQNTSRKTESYSFTWVMVFLAAENENRQLEDLPQADFGYVHENSSSFGKEKVINRKFSVVCFCNGSTHFFHLEPYHRRALRFFFRGLWNL